jgi:CDP-diacylglycerol--serine O-phosphatidyltransferase
VEQAGTAKVAFHGLPSPTAGVTLATYYAFTRTPLFQQYLGHLKVEQIAGWITVLIAGLMVSNVLYPVVPRFSFRTWSGRFATVLFLAALVAAFTIPAYFFFGVAAVYITYGLARTVVLGFLERLPERDPLLDEDEEEESRHLDYVDMRPRRRRRRLVRRRRQGGAFPEDYS